MMKKLIAAVMLLAGGEVTASDTYPQYAALVEKHAALQRLDKNMVWAVMGRESGGNRYALSNKNARGLLQVIPPTAARMGVHPKNLYDPEQNIIAGTRYLRFLCDRYFDATSKLGCNLDLVLAAYNAGEGAVDKYRGIPPYSETRHYVRAVKARYARLNNDTIPASAPAVLAEVVGRKTSVPYNKAVLTVKTNADAPVRIVRSKHQMQVAQHRPERKSWDVFGDF